MYDHDACDHDVRIRVSKITGRYWSVSLTTNIFRQEPSPGPNSDEFYMYHTGDEWRLASHHPDSDAFRLNPKLLAAIQGTNTSGPTGVIELPDLELPDGAFWDSNIFAVMSLSAFYEEMLFEAHDRIEDNTIC